MRTGARVRWWSGFARRTSRTGQPRRPSSTKRRRNTSSACRDRGHSQEALRHFEQAQTLANEDGMRVRAAIGIGVTWTDEDRLEQAESVLRSARAAALLADDTAVDWDARRALARCLLWQGRSAEAAALVQRGATNERG